MCGVGVSVSRASSTTEPTRASISGSRPHSTSCNIDVLCLPTFSAPSMRLSSVTRKLMPSLCATAWASRIIAAASSRVSGNWQMSTSVEWLRLLIGLKVKLPHSLSQISARMLSSTGALNPAATKRAATRLTRSLEEPSSSPKGKRSPSMCRTTPGAINSEAGYTTQPITRCAGMHRATVPLASTACTRAPSSLPPCL